MSELNNDQKRRAQALEAARAILTEEPKYDVTDLHSLATFILSGEDPWAPAPEPIDPRPSAEFLAGIIRERDAARADVENLTTSRQRALAERDAARREADSVFAQNRLLARERDGLRAERDELKADVDHVKAELTRKSRVLDGVRGARDRAQRERDRRPTWGLLEDAVRRYQRNPFTSRTAADEVARVFAHVKAEVQG